MKKLYWKFEKKSECACEKKAPENIKSIKSHDSRKMAQSLEYSIAAICVTGKEE